MKRALSLILSLLLISVLCFAPANVVLADGTPQFVVSNAVSAPGGSAEITVSIKNSPGIASIRMTVGFDQSLTLDSITYNGAIGGMSQLPETLNSSQVTLFWITLAPVSGDSLFATLSFTVDDFYDSPYKSITLSYDPEDVCDIDENNVHFDIVDGGISCAHANSSSEDAVASTCHTNGHNAYTVCYDCNTVISGSADPLPLDPSNHEGETELRGAAAPNCTGSGYSGDRYCLGCGAMIAEGEVLSALGHDYAGNVTDPTCTEQGYTTYTCTRCGDSYVDDYTAALGHTGGTATCHSKAVCEVCGTEYGEFDPDNHTGGTELRNERPISMTQAGYTGDLCCLGCDALLEPGEEFFVPGDADLDGELGVTDLIRLKKHLIDSSVEISVFADISGNGLILPNDLEYMRALIIGAEYTIVEP